jgi:hypothetical protein
MIINSMSLNIYYQRYILRGTGITGGMSDGDRRRRAFKLLMPKEHDRLLSSLH